MEAAKQRVWFGGTRSRAGLMHGNLRAGPCVASPVLCESTVEPGVLDRLGMYISETFDLHKDQERCIRVRAGYAC